MGDSKLIKLQIAIEAERTDDEPLHVKEWWIQSQVMDAMQERMPYINARINNTKIKMDSVKVVS